MGKLPASCAAGSAEAGAPADVREVAQEPERAVKDHAEECRTWNSEQNFLNVDRVRAALLTDKKSLGQVCFCAPGTAAVTWARLASHTCV